VGEAASDAAGQAARRALWEEPGLNTTDRRKAGDMLFLRIDKWRTEHLSYLDMTR
jgi:hypothetical protein